MIEGNTGRVGVDLLALDFARLDAAYHLRFGRLRIYSENTSRDPVRQIKPALLIRGNAFDDHGTIGAARIEIDQNGSRGRSCLHRRACCEK